jgi:uncharacterized protein (TIGR02118 family)
MIRVAVLYPNKPGAKFDYTYYAKKHMKLVQEKLRQMGLVKIEIDKGISGMPSGTPSPYITVGYLVFSSMDDLQKASVPIGGELHDDIPNFTNVEPQVQVSEIII